MEKVFEGIISLLVHNFRTQTKIEDLGSKVRIKTSLPTTKDEIHLILSKETVKKLKEIVNSIPDK